MGRYNAPGMPDITGTGSWSMGSGGTNLSPVISSRGAIQVVNSGISQATPRDGAGDIEISFIASRSNAEYGAQATVTPASTDMALGIYLGLAAKV